MNYSIAYPNLYVGLLQILQIVLDQTQMIEFYTSTCHLSFGLPSIGGDVPEQTTRQKTTVYSYCSHVLRGGCSGGSQTRHDVIVGISGDLGTATTYRLTD